MSDSLIRLRGVWKVFQKPILRGLDLDVRAGEALAVIGRSGTGKSVFLKTTVGLLRPEAGEVWVRGVQVSEASTAELAALRTRMGYVFQGAALFDSFSVYENVALGLSDDERRSIGEAEVVSRVAAALEDVELDARAVLSRYPAELSGGMRKRVGLARAIVGRPEMLFYDEPVTGLDPVTSSSVHALIRRLSRRVTTVLVTHDVDGALAVSDRVALLDEGRIRFAGSPDDFRTSNDPLVAAFRAGSAPRDPDRPSHD